jgi:AraC-like DNA-binding protein
MSNPDIDYSKTYAQRAFPQSGMAIFNLHEVGYQNWTARGPLRWNLQDVRRPFWYFYYNFKKGSSIVSRGKRYSVGPESLLLIPENVVFDCHGAREFPHLWMCFYLTYPHLASLRKPIAIGLTSALKEMLGDVRNQVMGGVQKVELFHASQSLLHYAFSEVFKKHKLQLVSNVKLISVLDFIRNRMSDPPGNAELAAYAHQSEGAFIRWFKLQVGEPPAQYSLKLRLQHASSLLAFGDESIEEIAMKCGFANRNHFSRVFAAEFKQGPAAFRRGFVAG